MPFKDDVTENIFRGKPNWGAVLWLACFIIPLAFMSNDVAMAWTFGYIGASIVYTLLTLYLTFKKR